MDSIHDLKPPKPVVFLEKLENCFLIIVKTKDDLVIYDYKTKQEYFREESKLFRLIVFRKCTGCKITTISKVLSLFFIDCTGLELCINNDIVGALSFLRCKNSNVSIRQEIGYVEIALCYSINLYQRVDKLLYIILSCMDLFVRVKNKETQLPNSMFGDRIFAYIEEEKIKSWTSLNFDSNTSLNTTQN
jgi:Adenylate cyclase associated (CAP) C terminal